MSMAFFCRAKPQQCDAFALFKRVGYVFIGWPLMRREMCYDPHSHSTCLVNPTCTDEEWQVQVKGGKVTKSHTKNRNFIRKVDTALEERGGGVVVLIPRPSDGMVHLGQINGMFEIINDPAWAQDYLRLRKDQNLNVMERPFWILTGLRRQ